MSRAYQEYLDSQDLEVDTIAVDCEPDPQEYAVWAFEEAARALKSQFGYRVEELIGIIEQTNESAAEPTRGNGPAPF